MGAALAAAAVVGVVLAKSKTAQAAPSAPVLPSVVPSLTPPSLSTTMLQAGHRYSVAQLAPIPGATVATVDQGQRLFDALAPGALRVVSITPGSGTQPTTLVLDILKTVPFTVPSTMPVTDLGPSPSAPAPTPMSFTATITDPATVRQYQAIVANALALPTAALPGMTVADYGLPDVDGNPSNPRWVRVLSALQTAVNPLLPAAVAAGRTPPGFPSQLRTDGVLDYATAVVIQNA